ncbi:MAG: NAD(P)/FAD-dependent oxidoreductase [Siphonobacter sp.]
MSTSYDAVVVGSGPNGLAAAITLQRAGLAVLLIEGKSSLGGGLRTEELTLPGFWHDICSAVHPMAVSSPFLSSLPLQSLGLEYLYPTIAAAHPFDRGPAAALFSSISQTALTLGADQARYERFASFLTQVWPRIASDTLGPLRIPKHPLDFIRFGLHAFPPVTWLSRLFQASAAKGLLAGMAAHAIQPLTNLTTSAIGLVLLTTGHLYGWPIPKGGSFRIAEALTAYFKSLGGQIETNFCVRSLEQLPASRAVLFDLTPRQLLPIAGHRFSSIYRWQLNRYRYGMGVFKIDWALDEPIPFSDPLCRQAGTLHLGNTIEEITWTEAQSARGQHPERPFVLLAQPSLLDASRAPKGKHTAWAYCHVPNGSTLDRTQAIEKQVERFAPGFRERILARHVINTQDFEAYNPNYIGGDINGGMLDLSQLFTRPALRYSPYRTSAKGLYICSSSTPPGGGVHGMSGYHAAQRALKDIFHS